MRLTSRPRPVALVLAAALLGTACGAELSAEQLEWCALNQAAVGSAAADLGLIDDAISFSEWKESNPDGYKRSCAHAWERRA